MRFIPTFVLALLTTHCGVEAGNAGKGRTGQVKIHFAQESGAGSESLNVAVGSLGLLNSEGSEVATLAPSLSSFDLYGSSSSDSILVAESAAIPVGSYSKIAIRLSGDKAVHYRDENGKEFEVGLGEDKERSFYISQAIEVVAGETTTIVVNLDPYNSLERSDKANSFIFNPRGEVTGQASKNRYEGSTTIANAKWACIYAFDVDDDDSSIGPWWKYRGRDRDDDDRKDKDRDRDDDRWSSKKPWFGIFGHSDNRSRWGREVEERPKVDSKSELVKDETSSCSRAYAKAPIKDGKFEFRYLDEGDYSLRIFSSNGSFQDLAEDVTISRRD